MKVKILKDTIADKRHVKAGSIEELPPKEANVLFHLRLAIAYIEADEKPIDVKDTKEATKPSNRSINTTELKTK